MSVRYVCTACRKTVTATKNHRYRSHSDGDGEPCEMSSVDIPDHLEPAGKDDAPDVPVAGVDYGVCPSCDRKVPLTKLGYYEPHTTTLRGGDRCPVSGVRYKNARKTEDVPLPGDATVEPAPDTAETSALPSPESTSTSELSPESTEDSPRSLFGSATRNFLQPGSPFLQPPEYSGPVKGVTGQLKQS